MSEATYVKIGVFVSAAVALIVVAVIVVGGKAATIDPVLVETYFRESVQGVDVGSAVKMKGVPIGKVKEIDFTSNYYDSEKPNVLILMSVDRAKFKSSEERDPAERLPELIERGLRTRLTSAGITGGVYLEIDFLPEVERNWNPPLEVDWTPKHLYVPSAPSTITRFKQGADHIYQEIKDADIPGTMGQIRGIVADMREQLSGPVQKILVDISETTEALPAAVHGIRDVAVVDLRDDMGRVTDAAVTLLEDDLGSAVRSLDEEVKRLGKEVSSLIVGLDGTVKNELSPALENMTSTSRALPETIERVNRTLKRLDRLVGAQQADVDEVLENLRVVSADLRDLVSTMKRHPSGALFGDPPGRVREEDDR